MSVDFLGKQNPDGTTLGYNTSAKISFYGVTPVVQQTGAAVGTDAATTQTLAVALRLAMVNLGLITAV